MDLALGNLKGHFDNGLYSVIVISRLRFINLLRGLNFYSTGIYLSSICDKSLPLSLK